MKRLSIIVPVYNLESCIQRCVTSLYHQDLPEEEYEVIFVNDGSTDRTEEKIRELWHENMLLLTQENARQGAARNNGLRHASGTYVWFVDGDDSIKENCLRHLVSILENQNLDILFTGQKSFSDSGVFLGIKNTASVEDALRVFDGKEYLKKRNLTLGPCYFFRRNFLLEHNLFFMEKTFYEDSEFMPRVCFYAKRVMHLDDAPYSIFLREGSSMRSVNPSLADNALKVSLRLLDFAGKHGRERGAADLFYYAIMIFNTALDRLSQKTREEKKIFWRRVPVWKFFYAMLRSRDIKYYGEIPYLGMMCILAKIKLLVR